jgi:hypothetical protein
MTTHEDPQQTSPEEKRPQKPKATLEEGCGVGISENASTEGSSEGSQTKSANLIKLVSDFCRDLSTTFPEYRQAWAAWEEGVEWSDEVKDALLGHLLRVFPERFFDILYQNESIFAADSEVPTDFLPGVEFKALWQLNISASTKQTLWKYLQLMLFQIMEDVHSRSSLGSAANMFEGIKEEELQAKITETFASLQDFFGKQAAAPSENPSEKAQQGNGTEGPKAEGAPPSPFANLFGSDPTKIQEHLRKLMDGKIGSLVKELVDDLKDDMEEMQKELSDKYGIPLDQMDAENMPMQDIMKELMRNPGKVSKIMRKVSDKLKTTMTSENRQEYVQETMEMLNQMGGKEEFMKMFDQMKGAMGSAANPFASSAGSENPMAAFANMFGGAQGAGKGTKVDQNAMDRMQKQQATKEKMRRQLEAKKLLKDKPDGSQVFRPEGAEPQAKTHLSDADLDQLMKQFGLEEDKEGKGKKGKGKSAATIGSSP